MYVLDKSKIGKKEADDRAMIGPPEKPAREWESFLVDAQGRIWRLMGVSDFAKYSRAHRSSFGGVWIDTASPKDSSSLAYQDTLRFMRSQLRKANAPVTVEGK